MPTLPNQPEPTDKEPQVAEALDFSKKVILQNVKIPKQIGNILPLIDNGLCKVADFLDRMGNTSGTFTIPGLNMVVVYSPDALSAISAPQKEVVKNKILKELDVEKELKNIAKSNTPKPAGDPHIDKGLKHIAIPMGGPKAEEGVMGDKSSHAEYGKLMKDFLNVRFESAGFVQKMHSYLDLWFKPNKEGKVEVNADITKYALANIMLERMFPETNWSMGNVEEFIGTMEAVAPKTATAFTDTLKKSQKQLDEIHLHNNHVKEVIPVYDALFRKLYESYINSENKSSNGIFAKFEKHFREKGVLKEGQLLTDNEKAWSDVKANLGTTLSASYETIATSFNEILRGCALDKALWNNTRTAITKNNDNFLLNMVYSGVQLSTPLPMAMRKSMKEHSFTYKTNKGQDTHTLNLQEGQRLLYIYRWPQLSKKMFPEGPKITGNLTDEQIEWINYCWGSEGGPGGRYCAGFGYSLRAQQELIKYFNNKFDISGIVDSKQENHAATNQRYGLKISLRERKSAA